MTGCSKLQHETRMLPVGEFGRFFAWRLQSGLLAAQIKAHLFQLSPEHARTGQEYLATNQMLSLVSYLPEIHMKVVAPAMLQHCNICGGGKFWDRPVVIHTHCHSGKPSELKVLSGLGKLPKPFGTL